MATLSVRCTGAMEGLDGQPSINPKFPGCGAVYAVDILRGDPADPATWSVKTDGDGNVVSRHASLTCPECGRSTFILEEDPT